MYTATCNLNFKAVISCTGETKGTVSQRIDANSRESTEPTLSAIGYTELNHNSTADESHHQSWHTMGVKGHHRMHGLVTFQNQHRVNHLLQS